MVTRTEVQLLDGKAGGLISGSYCLLTVKINNPSELSFSAVLFCAHNLVSLCV